MGFQQGLSGLNAASKNLDVIGNNVANANTVGFKQSQAQFADVYAASLSGAGGSPVGIGTKLATVAQQFTQGNISVTGNALDMAINGQGFFRMDNNGALAYARNGQFQLNKDGFIVSSQGSKLTGYAADATGNIVTGTPVSLQIPSADLIPQATTAAQVGLNLDARALLPSGLTQGKVVGSAAAGLIIVGTNDQLTVTVDGTSSGTVTIPNATYATAAALATAVQTAVNADALLLAAGKSVTVTAGATGILTITSNSAGPASTIAVANVGADTTVANLFTVATATAGTGVFSPNDPATYNSSTSTTIYDSLGNSHIATLYFQKAAAPNTTPSSNTWNTFLMVKDEVLALSGGSPGNRLKFDSSGALRTPPVGGVLTSAPFTAAGAAPQTLTFNFSTTTQFGAAFGVNKLSQDGYTSGRLNGFAASADGVILGRYTNGQSKALGQVALVNFANPQGLQPFGGNEWGETSTSGSPLVGVPGSGSLGVLQSAAVEDSNVDLTAELVNMIIAQRIYQANAQTIKAQDAMLQTLVNLR